MSESKHTRNERFLDALVEELQTMSDTDALEGENAESLVKLGNEILQEARYTARRIDDRAPEILPWPEMQKRAERERVDIMDYVNSMHAHILNQRDALRRQNEQLEWLRGELKQWQRAVSLLRGIANTCLSLEPTESMMRRALEKISGADVDVTAVSKICTHGPMAPEQCRECTPER